MRLTILFDSPYYVGLVEDERDGLLYAARQIFGAEPSDQLVYEFVQRDLLPLMRTMTVGVPVETRTTARVNPKRRLREVRRALAERGLTSAAHKAMRAQLEQNKQERQQDSRADREAHRQHVRAVAAEKARARHRGH
jgi:hypothetical protein